MSGSGKDFPDWETLYKNQKVETMPWYNEKFDFDLEKELEERRIINGSKKFLDLGIVLLYSYYLLSLFKFDQ